MICKYRQDRRGNGTGNQNPLLPPWSVLLCFPECGLDDEIIALAGIFLRYELFMGWCMQR